MAAPLHLLRDEDAADAGDRPDAPPVIDDALLPDAAHALPYVRDVPALVAALGIPREQAAWLIETAAKRARLAYGAPDPVDYADDDLQAEAAFWALYERKGAYARLPWTAADAITGPLVPGMLVTLGARTGSGKTTFLLNLLDRWVVAGRTLCYLGLEQTTKELRTKWACLRAGVPPEAALADDTTRLAGRSLADAHAAVAREIAWQTSEAVRFKARFAPTKFVNRRVLERVVRWAVDQGCGVVIVDHVDRLDHGEGRNSFAEMSATIRLAKEMAVEYGLVILLASQAKRVNDRLERFMPIELPDLRGGGTKEEESDIVLTTYRTLRPGVTMDELKLVRQGLLPEERVVQPHVMGVKNLKARLIDTTLGRTCTLAVRHGRIEDLTPAPGPPPTVSQHGRRDPDE